MKRRQQSDKSGHDPAETINRLCDDVFRGHPEIADHRDDFPWLTGWLGDLSAKVWFVAENPSLTQVRRAEGASPELQWSISRGDKLFRSMLVKHGFKKGGPDAHGGWNCYITDVIKSAAVVGEWNKSPRQTRRLIAEAWAPVLSYELTTGDPELVVVLGSKTEELLRHLTSRGLLPQLPATRRIDHYSYIALRPDAKRRTLGPGHPQRVAEWDSDFAAIVQQFRPSQRGPR